jgi:glycolate oxidase FAD binding subunit
VTVALDRAQTELGNIVGAARVVSDEKTRACLSVGGKTPQMVVYPSSAEQAAEILRYASHERLALIPCCNATELSIGNPPRDYDVALCMKEMNRVWHYEPEDLTVSAEPGMKFGDFQHFVGQHGLWLPLNPPGGASASLGGIVSTNATGSYRCHYGTPRDMVLGVKIATAKGKVVKAGGRVVKNVAGYDLTKLMIGSFGTLAVIVEMSFKLFPRPGERATFVLATGTLEKAREIRRALQLSPIRPHRAALLDASYIEFLKETGTLEDRGGGCEIWVEIGGTRRVVQRCFTELKQIAAGAGEDMREPVPDGKAQSAWQRIDEPYLDVRTSGDDWLLKAALPVSAVEEFMVRANRDLRRPEHSCRLWAEPLGGIVHLWLESHPGQAGLEDVTVKLRHLANDLGGSLIVEIAPPGGKAKVDAWGTVGDALEVMRKLKEAWDPNHILAPGRFVGGL